MKAEVGLSKEESGREVSSFAKGAQLGLTFANVGSLDIVANWKPPKELLFYVILSELRQLGDILLEYDFLDFLEEEN